MLICCCSMAGTKACSRCPARKSENVGFLDQDNNYFLVYQPPRQQADIERLKELTEIIKRYIENECTIPKSLLDEYNRMR